MQIALTGATGFLGRYLAAELATAGHTLRCWYRPSSDREGFEETADAIQWLPGQLGSVSACQQLVDGCQAVVHAALDRPGAEFRGGEGDLLTFVQTNLLGTLQLIEAARSAGVGRFVFISTCAVHEVILDDRLLDEAHPLWATSHYGAHKAAIEKFVHSFGLGEGYNICALRPTGIYGLARPAAHSKWYDLVQSVVEGQTVECQRGGKEVHAADVARAVQLLLNAEGIAGQAYNCYDRYVSQFEVATMARQLSGSDAQILGQETTPKHQIETGKIRALGMQFGGTELLERTIAQLVAAVR
ncbi:MAG: SDR family oxidoreductase [Planctomycetota bacterium]|nr:SDR family oxidoreductase [Planctomycetota bacterium]